LISASFPISEDLMFKWRLLVEDGRKAGHTYSQPDLIIRHGSTLRPHGRFAGHLDYARLECRYLTVVDSPIGRLIAARSRRTRRARPRCSYRSRMNSEEVGRVETSAEMEARVGIEVFHKALDGKPLLRLSGVHTYRVPCSTICGSRRARNAGN